MMRVGAAIAIAVGSMLGACAPKEEGVVITIHTPDGNGFEPVGKLELFLGGERDPAANNRRIRQVLDELGGEDLRPVDGLLDGYTIFLDGIPSDVKIVAVAAFATDPVEPEDYPVALGVIPISFTPGELTSAELVLRGVNSGIDRSAVRWRGPALDDPLIGHSCLAWAEQDGPIEQIVRDLDYDCDGTLPIACSDPNQDRRDLPDDLPNQDRDGDGQFTCARCTSQTTGAEVPCDCNDDPAMNGAAQNATLPEVCDGIDNDCDDMTFFISPPDDYAPCMLPGPSGECEVGMFGCDERLGEFATDECRHVTTTLMGPCGMSLDAACSANDNCTIVVIDETQMLDCASDYAGEGCGGSVTVAELIANLGVAIPPITCSAVLWSSDEGNWSVRLADLNQTGARVIIDQPCDTIQVTLENQGTQAEPFGAVVLAFDTLTGERYALPVSFASVAAGVCSVPPMTCLPPN